MSDTSALYVSQFTTNVQLLLQQMESRFRGAVMIQNCVGKQAAVVDQFGKVEARKRIERYPELTPRTTPNDRRWVKPTEYDWVDWIDNQDNLRMLIDPQSSYVKSAVAALNRAMDDEIVTAWYGTALTGEAAGTSTSHDTTNQRIAVNFGSGGNTGLTVAKLKQANKILRAAENDPDEERFCAISAKQEEDLLNEIQVVSLDYNERPVLMDGRVRRFLGINFIPSERISVDSSSYRRVPVWVKSGMCLGMWGDVKTTVNEIVTRAGSPHPWQVYACGTFGATRTQEKKIVEILCNEA